MTRPLPDDWALFSRAAIFQVEDAAETFIKQYPSSQLSERVAIGTGEIIDANSRPGQKRNQIDLTTATSRILSAGWANFATGEPCR